MKYRKLQTSKLYYGKWPYKIECICAGSWMIKRSGVAETLQYCKSNHNYSIGYRREQINKPKLQDFAINVKEFLGRTDLQIRCEGGTFSIYCKDTDLYTDILTKLSGYITEIHEPSTADELEYMLTHSHKKVVCNQLPYELYQYRVYFKAGCDQDTKRKFASWIVNYDNKVKIPDNTVKWMIRGWMPSPYIYIKDQATLSMIGLFMGQAVHKVEEFILRSSINTCLDQEKLCQDSVAA